MALTTGTTNVCQQHSGGLVAVFMIDRDDIAEDGSDLTLTGDDYSAITTQGGAVFQKFEFEQDTAARRETTTRGDSGNTVIQHEVELANTQLNSANRKAIQDLIDSSACGVIAIVEDANSNKWVVGYSEKFTNQRPLRIATSTLDTGTSFEDGDSEIIILDSRDNTKDRLFTGTVPV